MQRGLPAKYFTDNDIYGREWDRIFRSSWLYVGLAEKLQQLHQYRTFKVEERSVLVVRTELGLRAYHNVCRHRGAELCAEERGSLINGCIQCPYHAWTYDSDGSLRSAPNMWNDSESEFDAAEFGLIEIGCVDWQGLIMLNFEKPASSFTVSFGQITNHLTPWSIEKLRLGAARTYRVQANWKLLFQNFSECYHCPTVHPSLAQLTPFRSATNEFIEGPFLGGPMLLSDEAETMSGDGRFVAKPILRAIPQQARQVHYYTLFPSMFISPHPDYVMLHRLQRVDSQTTDVSCEFLFDEESLISGNVDGERAASFWDEVNRQDWHVCELVQRGAGANLPPGPYGPYETVLPEFDRHYLAKMAD